MKTYLTLSVLIFSLLVANSCKKENTYSLDYDMQVLEEVNKYRESQGLGRLEFDNFLWELANEHSAYMADINGLVNTDNRDVRYTRIRQEYGYSNVGENVASGIENAKVVVEQWTGSITLVDIMKGDYNISAVSAVKSKTGTVYYTQIFYKKL